MSDMRKSLICFILLLALAVAALAAGHGAVSAMADDVVITEETRYGDPAAAQGLTVSLHTNYGNQLFWRTVCAAGPETAPETEFSFSNVRIYDVRLSRDYVFLDTGGTNFSISGSNLDLEDPQGALWEDGGAAPMQRPAADVASRTPAGETHTETVCLRDYYEYYTVGLTSNTETAFGRWVDLHGQNLQDLSQYFRFPVEEDRQMEVTVSKDQDGAVYEICCNAVDGGNGIKGDGIVTAQGFYLILHTEADAETGRPLPDFSQVAGGYGVYFIPVEQEETGRLNVRTDRIQNIYPLDPASAQTVGLAASQDGTQLLLFTLEGGRLVLTVLNEETRQPLQRLPLPASESPVCYQTEQLLILRFWGETERLLVLTREEGVYDLWMDAPMLPELEEEWPYLNDPQFAFDGSRLAMASFADYGSSPFLRLLVYDQTGPIYAGCYDHNGGGNLLRMGTDWSDALVLSWAAH